MRDNVSQENADKNIKQQPANECCTMHMCSEKKEKGNCSRSIRFVSFDFISFHFIYLKADLACIIMASIRIVVAAYVFGEVMLCG